MSPLMSSHQRCASAMAILAITLSLIGCFSTQELVELWGFGPQAEAELPDPIFNYEPFVQGTTDLGMPYLGSENAPVLVEIFSSFSCSPCRSFYELYFVPLRERVLEGSVRVVYYPLTDFGSWRSTNMARAAFCAAQQGKFWEMQQVLFDWQARYGQASEDPIRLRRGAVGLGLQRNEFEACMTSEHSSHMIQAARDAARDRDVSVTPTAFLNGEIVYPTLPGGESALTANQLLARIDNLLGE